MVAGSVGLSLQRDNDIRDYKEEFPYSLLLHSVVNQNTNKRVYKIMDRGGRLTFVQQ